MSKECWVTEFTLRGHIEDVNDLSWSADGSILGSSGIDHSIILWDADLVIFSRITILTNFRLSSFLIEVIRKWDFIFNLKVT